MICNNIALDCGNAEMKHGMQKERALARETPANGARGRMTAQVFTDISVMTRVHDLFGTIVPQRA
eukprot:293900-Lingulodinium_polyedra.AAC.1